MPARRKGRGGPVTAEEYAAYWAALTGRSPREIYVPAALRAEALAADAGDGRTLAVSAD